MIRFALRLALRGGRESLTRLVIIAAAVGLGVGLLLTTIASVNAVNAQNSRYSWLESGALSSAPSTSDRTHDPLWWLLSADEYRGKIIGRVDVAATGPTSPVPPGLSHLPGPGQFYASPALAQLLRTVPSGQLGDRYPGQEVGTIGAAGLPAPDSLLILIGHTPAQMAQMQGATQITAISTISPSSCNGPHCLTIGINGRSVDLILSVVAAALLLPILIFIGTATRLSAARREQRFAAMRLVGATPRQVAVISAVESTVAAASGVAIGFAVFYVLRSPLASIPFTGSPFFVSDLSLNILDILSVIAGVPLAAAAVSRGALRRTVVSPLGVTRRMSPAPPRAWRVLPLLAGLAELGWYVMAGRPSTTAGQVRAFLPGIMLTMVGLVVVGPWLTLMSSRLAAARATRPATLIACRRLADNPQAGFRSVSGMAMALFAVTIGFAVITTMNANGGSLTPESAADRSTLVAGLGDPVGPNPSLPSSIAAPTLTRLEATPGVTGVIPIRQAPSDTSPTFGGPAQGVMTCAQLAAAPALGRCAAGHTTALIDPYDAYAGPSSRPAASAGLRPADLGRLPVIAVVVTTNGNQHAIEQARTLLELAYPSSGPVTPAEDRAQTANVRRKAGYQRLADVGILASLPIAGCTLAVSIVAGLNDRRRPFSLLRLTGAPMRTLRHVVALESVVPLLTTALVASGTGFLASYLFLRAQLGENLKAPGAEYFGLVLAGLGVALALMASTLPVLERVTGPETARNE